MSLRPISTRDKCDCVRRELALRMRVYPGWVARHKMSVKNAEREIEVMTAIVEDYCRLADQESREERLL